MCKNFPDNNLLPNPLGLWWNTADYCFLRYICPSQIFRKLCKVSEHFPESPESLYTVRKLYRLYNNFAKCPETFQRFQRLSRVSENFQEVRETFQSVCKLSRVSGKFSRVYINFPECPETFQIFVTFSMIKKIFRVCRKFPDCHFFLFNFIFLSNFYVPTQKLSGLQKLSIQRFFWLCLTTVSDVWADTQFPTIKFHTSLETLLSHRCWPLGPTTISPERSHKM